MCICPEKKITSPYQIIDVNVSLLAVLMHIVVAVGESLSFVKLRV